MTFFKIAWKNLFRNSRRTIIAGSAIGLGLAGLIFTDALMVGMERNMVDNATGTHTGHGQIHHPQFRENNEVELTVRDSEKMVKSLRSSPEIAHFSSRVISSVLISSPSKSQSVPLWGVNPSDEKALSKMDDRLSSGSLYLPHSNSILIGQGLAEELDVTLGDRLIITAAEFHTGEPSQQLVVIDGIYSFGSKDVDMACVLVQQKAAQSLLGLQENQFHEIALKLNDATIAENPDDAFWKRISGKNMAEPWVVLMSELQMVLKMTSFSKWILAGLLLALVGLNIINTLFMAIYERLFEFAVLKSIGTSRCQLFRMIVYEAGSLALVASLIGMAVGYLLSRWVMVVGVNFNAIEYSGITFYEKIYPVIEPMQYIVHPLILLVFTILISFYPALYAARMTPVEALKKTL